MLTDEAPRDTEHTEGGPQQHDCGAAVWDPSYSRRRREWTARCAGVLVKRKHCGTEDHSHQREFPYRDDIVFHKLLIVCKISKQGQYQVQRSF
jgi:hypothetical protein